MKRLIYLGLAVIFLMGMFPIHPAVGIVCSPTIVVTNTNDSGAGSLRQAVADVCPDGTISFDVSLSGATITLSSSLVLAKSMTIDGSMLSSKVTISGGGAVRVLWVNNGITVTLNTLIIADGKIAGDGGGIYNGTGSLTVLNSVLLNNEGNKPDGPKSWGGGIHNAGGHLEVINSRLDGNQATYLGGGIYNDAGTVIVQNSILASNSAQLGGGGVFNTDGGTLTVINSTFSKNLAQIGGGIYTQSVASTVIVSGSTFVQNTSTETLGPGGGGIYISAGSVTVTNSTFSGNSAASWGAAVMNFGTLSLFNSTLSGNSGQQTLINGQEPAVLNYANTIIANTSGGEDCSNINYSTIGTNTNNLVKDGSCYPAYHVDPMLSPLADNGGPTWTMALMTGSPAIDAGDDSTCAGALVNGVDQRGAARTVGLHCDIGAYEFGGVIPNTPPPVIAYHEDITVTAESAAGEIVTYTSPAVRNIVGGPGTATCTPASGSVFSPGDTIVTCTFEDASGNDAAPTTFAVRVVDSTPPVIASHDDVTAEATSAAGAIVTYTSPATSDVVDGPGTASCTPVSGSQFSLGDTTITCTAQDAAGNHATPTTFTVHVVDTTAPEVTVPSNMTVTATGPSGATVEFSATAYDLVDGAITPTCNPVSGSLFPIGTALVTCTAIDAAHNQGQASFTVTVENQTYTIYLPFILVGGSQ